MTSNQTPSSPLPEPAENASAAWVPGGDASTPESFQTYDYSNGATPTGSTEWFALSDPTFEPVSRGKKRTWLVPALAAAALTVGLAGGAMAAGVATTSATPSAVSSSTLAGGLPPISGEDDGGPGIAGADSETDSGPTGVMPGTGSSGTALAGTGVSGSSGTTATTGTTGGAATAPTAGQ